MSISYPFPMPWPTAFMEAPSPPAAGANMSVQLAGQYRHHILTVNMILTTDANVANRFVSLSVTQSANRLYRQFCSLAIAAGTTQQIIFNVGTGTSQQVGAQNLQLEPLNPWFIVEPAWSFEITVDNIQVGDQLSAILVTYGRWNRPGEET